MDGIARGEPTAHPPGTLGKIAVLAARAARREPLFHPGDAPLGEEHAPVSDRRTGPALARRDVGVTRSGRRWRARVWVRGRGQVHVGLYPTAEEAAEAARRARGMD